MKVGVGMMSGFWICCLFSGTSRGSTVRGARSTLSVFYKDWVPHCLPASFAVALKKKKTE